MSAVAIAIFVSLVTIIFWALKPNRTKYLIDKIPGPPALPLIGNAHLFKPGGSDFMEQILGWAREYSERSVFRLWLGIYPTVALRKADSVEALLSSSKHITKSRDYNFLHPWLGTGLLTSTGEKWHQRRKLLTPSFHFRILNDFMQVFNEHSAMMVKNLHGQTGKGVFDMFPFITLCTLDIICDTAMGTHVNAQEDSESDYVKAIYKVSTIVQRRQKTPWLWPDFLFNLTQDGRDFKECLQILHGFTKKVIKERKTQYKAEELAKLAEETTAQAKNGITEEDEDEAVMMSSKKKRLAFLDMLLYASDDGRVLDDDDIREEVDTFMFEGHDTTAAAGNWAVHFIGANPDVQKKLHEEMDDIFGDSDRDVTMADINKMKYLDYVIKEALRLFPSVPMFAREISEDCVVGGYEIPKGTTAVILTSALHRDPDHFPDPEKFDPDRWTPERSTGRHPFCYVPFSAGFRNCIGQKFAVNEEKVVLSAILRNFTITSHQTREELRPVGELILRPENGILVSIEPRKK